MFSCDHCRLAGDLLTYWRKYRGRITPARRNRLEKLHDKCPGKTQCACQHRLPDVE